MKKISCLVLLTFVLCSSFSEPGTSPLIMNFYKIVDAKASCFYFLLKTDNANVLNKLVHSLGTPQSNTGGTMEWHNMSIDGVGEHLNIVITDGLFTHDTASRTACFVPFKSAGEKETLLKLIRPNQERESRIKIEDKSGNTLTSNGVTEYKAQAFFDAKLN